MATSLIWSSDEFGAWLASLAAVGRGTAFSLFIAPQAFATRGQRGGLTRGQRTRGKGLLELLGLVGVLEDEGVQVALAADLELDLGVLVAALDASGYDEKC